MEFSLRCAYAHGTKAIRTHLDSIPPQEQISWPVFEEMRAALAGPHRAAGGVPVRHRRRPRFRLAGDAGQARRRGERRARHRHLHGAGPRATARPHLRACDRARARPRFPRRRDRRHRGDLAEEDRRGGTAPQIRGQDPGRPLLLAGAAAGQGRARHAGQGGAGRGRRRVAADVQSLSAGPPA